MYKTRVLNKKKKFDLCVMRGISEDRESLLLFQQNGF